MAGVGPPVICIIRAVKKIPEMKVELHSFVPCSSRSLACACVSSVVYQLS